MKKISILFLMFFCLASCVQVKPIVFEFELTSCPESKWSMPKKMNAFEWEATFEGDIKCGHYHYFFREEKRPVVSGNRKQNWNIYLKLERNTTCKLSVATIYSASLCTDKTLKECAAFKDAEQQVEHYVKVFFNGQPFSAKTTAANITTFSNIADYDKWCQKNQ